MEISFGIPGRKSVTRVEKYPDTPVMVMYPKPDKKGGYKFELNLKAIEFLGLELNGEENISFGFTPKPRTAVYIGTPSTGSRVTKSGTFSDSKMYSYIETYLGLDSSIVNEFEIVIDPAVTNAFRLELIKNTVQQLDELSTESEIDSLTQTEVEEATSLVDEVA
jgi:hypothetical protein